MNRKKLIVYITSMVLFILLSLLIVNLFGKITYSPYRVIRNEFNLDLAECKISIKEETGSTLYYALSCSEEVINKLNKFDLLPLNNKDLNNLKNCEKLNNIMDISNGFYKINYRASNNYAIGYYDTNFKVFYYYEMKKDEI